MGIPPPQCAQRKHRSRPSLLRCGDRVICCVVKRFYFYILVMFEAQPLPLEPGSTALKSQFGNSFEKGWLKPGGQMQSSFYMDGCERFSVSGRWCCMFCEFCDTQLQPPAQNLCSGAVMMLLDVIGPWTPITAGEYPADRWEVSTKGCGLIHTVESIEGQPKPFLFRHKHQGCRCF